MRCFAVLLALLVSAAILSISSGQIEDTGAVVSVRANAWDLDNCSRDGCSPELTRDKNLDNSSRWSCQYNLAQETCKIWYSFDEGPRSIAGIRIKFFEGEERTYRFKFIAYDGDSEQFDNTFTSTMSSLLGDGYENFNFKGNPYKSDSFSLEAVDLENSEWLGIIETMIISP